MSELEERKKEFFEKLQKGKGYTNYIVYLILAAILWLGWLTRTRNLGLLKDITTGKYIPADPDAFAFLRYAQYIQDHGQLMAVDTLRYYPIGWSNLDEFRILAYFIAYLYKLLHIFDPTITLNYVDVIYPALAFIVGLVFFFLFVKKLLDWRHAIISTAFLCVIPSYLFRTMAGISDKESLAFTVMFMFLYFYTVSWKSKNTHKRVIFGALAGFANGIMGLIWGGVSYTFLFMGAYCFFSLLLDKFDKEDLISYGSWLVTLLITLMVGYPARFHISVLIVSLSSSMMIIGFGAAIINYLVFDRDLLKVKHKIESKLPPGLASVLIIIVISIVGSLFYSPTFVFAQIHGLFHTLLVPLQSRWAYTVAESHRSYFTNLLSELGWKFVALIGAGFVIVIYDAVKPLKRKAYWIAAISAAFITIFSIARYDPNAAVLNGTTFTSNFLFAGSFVGFFVLLIFFYIRSFLKDKETFQEVKQINKYNILIMMFTLLFFMGALSQIRLVFAFGPAMALLAGYFSVSVFDKIKNQKMHDAYKIVAYILLLLLVGTMIVNYAKSTYNTAQYTGPGYDRQWQVAMDWVRKNTPEDAVFAHWWDYGYWVQGGAGRATLSDGGNSRGAINYFIGRHVLTGQSDTEALELLKANEANYLLMVQEEIGKYPAFSSIGSDVNYDRYSWISTMMLNQEQTKETRNQTMFVYTGGIALDDDFIYKGKLFPARSSGIAGIVIPVDNEPKNESFLNKMQQPTAVLVYNNQAEYVPFGCVFFENKEKTFEVPGGLEGCLGIIPTIDSNGQANLLGAGLYLSPDVRKSRFAQLYLMNKENDYFQIAYSDESQMPLAIYNGRLIGPIKIWKISYPSNLTIPKEYYGEDLPDPRVDEVKEGYY